MRDDGTPLAAIGFNANYTDISKPTLPPDVKREAGLKKPQLVLMPPDAEEMVCKVLESGAAKYGVNVDISPIRFLTLVAIGIELEKCLEKDYSQHAIQKENTPVEDCVLSVIENFTQKHKEPNAILLEYVGERDFASAVTTKNSRIKILSIVKDRKKIVPTTTKKTQNNKRQLEENTTNFQELKYKIPRREETERYCLWEFTHVLKIALLQNKEEVAQFVAKSLMLTGLSQNCNSTTTMIRDCLGVCYADVAIKDLGFWGILLREFNERFSILTTFLQAPITIESQKIKCYSRGPWNWRSSGVEVSTYISAIKRHLAAIHRGEWLDPESGLPHMAHVAASACIVLDADEHGCLNKDVTHTTKP